jgi:hypothetical protein
MDEELVPEAAFPGRRRLSIWAKRVQRKLFRVLDARSRLICLVVAVPSVVAAGAGLTGLLTTPAREPVDAALLSEARQLDLDYQTVFSSPSAHAGKPVLWCLIKDDNSRRYVVGGNLSWPVEIDGPSLPPMPTARMGVCHDTLAVVEGRGEYGVRLRFAGHP